MRNRSFTIFGGLAAILAAALFLVLNQSLDIAWYWNWLIAVNLIALVFYRYDKAAASARGGRIPERVLHLIALAGGFVGALLGIWRFNHKSNARAHPSFVPIIVISALIWAVIVYFSWAGMP